MALLLIQGYVGMGMGEKVRSSDFLACWLPQLVRDIGMVSVGNPVVE